jgi:hypothetical protein
VGTLLEAYQKLEEQYPGSCEIYLGDFSRKGGGRLRGHESHQNGRDVDVGLFAKGNMQLNRFMVMDSRVLDTSKTWKLMRNLLDTQRVQTISQVRSYPARRSSSRTGSPSPRDAATSRTRSGMSIVCRILGCVQGTAIRWSGG